MVGAVHWSRQHCITFYVSLLFGTLIQNETYKMKSKHQTSSFCDLSSVWFWIGCFQMKYKYWDQYTVIIVSSSMSLFFNHSSWLDFILHRWTCTHTYSSLFFTLLDNSHYSSWWCVIRGLHSFKVANEMMAMTINSPATATNNNREIAGKVKIPHKLFMHMIPF